jgi:hypothetical protein
MKDKPKTKPKPEPIKYDLFENGLDFLLSGLEHLSRKPLDKRDYKFGILHLAAGIELILKERLRREHWSLLFENVDKANAGAMASGDFKSVMFESLVDRLAGVAKVTISKHEFQAIDDLRKRRNKVQHLHITETPEVIESLAARAVGFALDFIENELAPKKMSLGEARMFEEIKDKLKDFEAFVAKRLKFLEARLKKAEADGGTIVDCVRCLQRGLLIDGEEPKCLFCNSSFEPLGLADDWASQFLGRSGYEAATRGGEPPTKQCPNCAEDALVEVGEASGFKAQWLCFSCASTWSSDGLSHCSSCESVFEGRGAICDGCFEARLSRD